MLKQVRGSLPGIASAFRCYAAFCGVADFPPSGVTVLRRGSVFFNYTSTCGGYLSRLKKAFFFTRQSTARRTPSARHVAKGVKKGAKSQFSFSHFTRSHLLAESSIASRQEANLRHLPSFLSSAPFVYHLKLASYEGRIPRAICQISPPAWKFPH